MKHYFSTMESHNYDKLQILAAKTLDLHRKINDKINQHSFTFCSHCSSHGRYCVVADSRPEEREKMIAISDSLKELHKAIVSLEKVKSNHKRQRDEALARIGEGRKLVRERVRRCSKEERENLGVLEEVIEFVGDGKSDEFLWIMEWEMDEKNANGIYSFLVGTTRFGLEFLVIFATIYTSLKFYKIGKEKNHGLQQKEVTDSRIQKPRFLQTDDFQLDVLCGRG